MPAIALPRRLSSLPLRGARRSRASRLPSWLQDDRATVALAAGTVVIGGAVLVGQYGRLLTRRQHEAHQGNTPLGTAPVVAGLDTVGVAVEGYAATPRREVVLFNLLSGFLGAFATVRLTTWGIRAGRGPFRNVSVKGRHIHHFVPGILIAFASGIAALLTQSQKAEDRLAVPLGVGMGLTFDEAALLLDLRDVYWSREGLLSVQISLGTGATLGAVILLMRILSRGTSRQERAGNIPQAEHPTHFPSAWLPDA